MVTKKKPNKKEEQKYYVVFYDEKDLMEEIDACKCLDEAMLVLEDSFVGGEAYIAELQLVNKKRYVKRYIESE